MAFDKPLTGEPQTFNDAVFSERLDGVLGARGRKPAFCAK
jgi:hypothetical protein